MKKNKASNLIGCCGIYCGLCTRYQSKAPGRCVGCRLTTQHDWCSIYRCCGKKKELITCAECREYPCGKYIKFRKWGGELYGSKAAEINLHKIKEHGLAAWLGEQRQRQALFEGLLRNYNEGRSMSFYCKACTRMPVALIKDAVREGRKKINEEAGKSDLKLKAKFIKEVITNSASKARVMLF